jgi:pectinesterase
MTSRLLSLTMAVACASLTAAQQPTAPPSPVGSGGAIVAADGSGTYKTVQEAIDAVPQNTSASNRWTIFIKAGTYRERVYVQREKRFVTLVGEDAARTIISYNLNAPVRYLSARRIGQMGSATQVILRSKDES